MATSGANNMQVNKKVYEQSNSAKRQSVPLEADIGKKTDGHSHARQNQLSY